MAVTLVKEAFPVLLVSWLPLQPELSIAKFNRTYNLAQKETGKTASDQCNHLMFQALIYFVHHPSYYELAQVGALCLFSLAIRLNGIPGKAIVMLPQSPP